MNEHLFGSPNLNQFLKKFGFLCFRVIFEHAKSFKYSPSGAVKLKYDFKEYLKVSKVFESKQIIALFDCLVILVNLLTLPTENLDVIIEDDRMKAFSETVIQSFLRLRAD